MLGDPGEDFDDQLKTDLHSLIRKTDDCANFHFRKGTRIIEYHHEIVELLQHTVIAEGQGSQDPTAEVPLRDWFIYLDTPNSEKMGHIISLLLRSASH